MGAGGRPEEDGTEEEGAEVVHIFGRGGEGRMCESRGEAERGGAE